MIPPTETQSGTTQEKPIDSTQMCTPKSNRPATPSNASSSSDDDDDDTEDEGYVCCLIEWLCLDAGCKSMLDNQTKMFAHL